LFRIFGLQMAYESSTLSVLSVSWCGFSVSYALSTRPFIRHLLIDLYINSININILFGIIFGLRARDGQRFLMLKSSEREAAAPTQINVVLNWFEELKRRVPPGTK